MMRNVALAVEEILSPDSLTSESIEQLELLQQQIEKRLSEHQRNSNKCQDSLNNSKPTNELQSNSQSNLQEIPQIPQIPQISNHAQIDPTLSLPRNASCSLSCADLSAQSSTPFHSNFTDTSSSRSVQSNPHSFDSKPNNYQRVNIGNIKEAAKVLSQNLGRLAFLSKEIDNPKGYEEACHELESWCSDRRAYTVEIAGDLNRVFQKIFENSLLPNFNARAGYRVFEVARHFFPVMIESAASNIREWMDIMNMKSQNENSNWLEEKNAMMTRSLARLAELCAGSNAAIKRIINLPEEILAPRLFQPIKQFTPTPRIASIDKIPKQNLKIIDTKKARFPFWIENSIEPFTLLPDATIVDISFIISEERFKYFERKPNGVPEYTLLLITRRVDDILKRHEWPISMKFVDMNSFRINVQKKAPVSPGPGHPPTFCGYNAPVDLSAFLKIGNNNLRINLEQFPMKQSYTCHLEVIAHFSKQKSMEFICKKQIIQENQSIEFINKLIKPSDDDDVQILQDHLDIDLRCPFSLRKIKLPAKGIQCTHPKCFDLENWLDSHANCNTYSCPICSKSLTIDQIYIDNFIKKIIQETKTEVLIVSIEYGGIYKPLLVEDSFQSSTNNQKRKPKISGKEISKQSLPNANDKELSLIKKLKLI